MRFYEFAQAKRDVLSTNRFDRDYRDYESQILPKFNDFIEFRRVALPQDGFSKKDAVFTGSSLAGWRHVHLVHGKVILIYRVDARHVFLACIVTHKDTEAQGRLTGYLTGIGAGDFHPFEIQSSEEAATGLSPDQIAEVESVVYEYAASHRAVLDAFVQGKTDREFAEMLCLSVDLPLSREALDRVFAAFGGRDGFARKVAAILKQTA